MKKRIFYGYKQHIKLSSVSAAGRRNLSGLITTWNSNSITESKMVMLKEPETASM
jgi:hypothetical protein